MKKLIKLNEEKLTSLKLAEITNKRHDHIMRDIKDEISQIGEKLSLPIFGESDYTNNRGKIYPMFKITKRGWLQMGARYDAKIRFAIIDYVENIDIPKDLPTALRAYAFALDRNRFLETEIKILTPKADSYNTFMNSSGWYTLDSVAEKLKIPKGKGKGVYGRTLLAAWLRYHKVFKPNSTKVLKTWIDRGWAQIKTSSVGYDYSVFSSKGIQALERIRNIEIKEQTYKLKGII